MGFNWKDTKQARCKNRGPMKTKKLTRFAIRNNRILDKEGNEYTLDQVRELILINLAITEDENLLDLLERGE